MLMKRCGEGFWTGDPDIFPTGEGQLGVFSTLGLEPPANLRIKPVCIGERVGLPLAAQGATGPSTQPTGWNSWKLSRAPGRAKEGQLRDLVVSKRHQPSSCVWVHRGALTLMTHKV